MNYNYNKNANIFVVNLNFVWQEQEFQQIDRRKTLISASSRVGFPNINGRECHCLKSQFKLTTKSLYLIIFLK